MELLIIEDSERLRQSLKAGFKRLGYVIDVDDVSGPLEGGGTFNITTDAGTETLLGIKLGIRQSLGDYWSANYALRYDYHLADWNVTDTISSSTTDIGNYSTYGILVGVSRKF